MSLPLPEPQIETKVRWSRPHQGFEARPFCRFPTNNGKDNNNDHADTNDIPRLLLRSIQEQSAL